MDKDSLLKMLGEKVRSRRTELNISQEELAFKCGFDRTYISLVERGKRNISLLNLCKLSNALEIDLSELIKGISWH